MPRSKVEGLLDGLKTVYCKYPQRLIGVLLTFGAYTMYGLYASLKTAGFTGAYPRVKFITGKPGELCQQVLEHGVEPQNDFLPPHLRLDKLSYLDLPQTELVVPPILDLFPDTQQMKGSADVSKLPKSLASSTVTEIGTISATTTFIRKQVQNTRGRNLPVTPKSIEAMEKEIEKAHKVTSSFWFW